MAKITEISSNPVVVVTLEEAKAFLRVDHDQDDTLITSLVSQATEEAQSYTGLFFGEATYTHEDYGGGIVWLTYPQPLVSVDSVQVDGEDVEWKDNLNGSITVYDVSAYDVVTIGYTVGMNEVKEDIKSAILQRVKFAFDYGDDLIYGRGDNLRFFDRILFRYRNIFTS